MTTLLPPDDIRALVPEIGLDDESIQLLLDAAEAEIIRYAGDSGSATEWHDGGQRLVALKRQAASITSVTEQWYTDSTTLAADDYEVDPSGYLIYRRGDGTNPRWRWWGRVVVVYEPVDDEAIRKGVEAGLVALMVNYQPGANSETVGSWTTQLTSNATWNNSTERDAILARLIEHGRLAII